MLYPNGTTARPTVSSPYGPRDPRVGVSSWHNGVDLVGFETIHAVAAGRVTFAGWMNNAAGYTIVIDHGNGVSSVYMHNDSHHVARGQHVAAGLPIAVMGRSGNASGRCNHLEIRVHGKSVEPLAYIAARLTRDGAASAPTTTLEDDDMRVIIINDNWYTIDVEFLHHIDAGAQPSEAQALYGTARDLGDGPDALTRFVAQLDLHGIPRNVLDNNGRVFNPQSGKYETNGTWSRKRQLLAAAGVK